jgi:hypothetical protein
MGQQWPTDQVDLVSPHTEKLQKKTIGERSLFAFKQRNCFKLLNTWHIPKEDRQKLCVMQFSGYHFCDLGAPITEMIARKLYHAQIFSILCAV